MITWKTYRPSLLFRNIWLVIGIASLILPGCSTTQRNLRVLNPIAAETPVYRRTSNSIVINLNLLVPSTQQPVTVYKGYSYDAIDWLQPIANQKEGLVDIPIEDHNQQHFFGVVLNQGDTIRTAERSIPINGTDNLRDLGGYVTTSGKVTKWGCLYRSGGLSDLKSRDQAFFQHLNIKTVIDFRDREERKRNPDRLPDKLTNVVSASVYDLTFTRKQYRKKLQSMKATDDPEKILINLNRMYVTQFADSFAVAIKALIKEDYDAMSASLYHCSAGKDRTGFMSAVLLTILGVPRETIMRDYLAFNYYRYARIQRRARLAPLIGIRSDVARALLEVRPVYLKEAFRAIEEEYGSVEQYVRQALDISEEQQMIIRQQYLMKQTNSTEFEGVR